MRLEEHKYQVIYSHSDTSQYYVFTKMQAFNVPIKTDHCFLLLLSSLLVCWKSSFSAKPRAGLVKMIYIHNLVDKRR